jgi:hypothetical protein
MQTFRKHKIQNSSSTQISAGDDETLILPQSL